MKINQWLKNGLLEGKVTSKIITKILFKTNIEKTNREQIDSGTIEYDSVYDGVNKCKM